MHLNQLQWKVNIKGIRLAKHIFKMPAGLFDVGNLRLGNRFEGENVLL